MADQNKKNIKAAEKAVDRAFSTGKADRATITHLAQLDAAEAVAMAGVAMEADEAADEAAKLTIIAAGMGNKEKTKAAREREREARNRAKEDHKAATKSAKRAYDAIKYSDPNSLGFLRVVQVGMLIHIIGTLLALILTSRDTVVYSSTNIYTWIMVVFESLAFYFLVNRYKLAKPLVIAMAGVGVLTRVIPPIVNGTFDFWDVLLSCAFYVFIIVYFATSERVRATLINDLSSDKGAFDDEDFVIVRSGWPFWRNLIIYFVVFSLLGHWMEAGFCQLIRLGIMDGEFHPENTMLWRDWFFPYAMHGAAVDLIALILYPLFIWLKKRSKNRIVPYVQSYLINMCTCTLIELIGGLLFNSHLQNWDYSNLPFNFMGQICLQNALCFGVASSAICWWLYPMMERSIARVKPATMNIVCVIVAGIGAILFALYAINPKLGIDLGENSEQSAQTQEAMEIVSLTADYVYLTKYADDLQDTLDNSQHLSDEEKAQLQEQLDELKADIEGLDNLITTMADERSSAE